ncbi:SAM-dependent methyltransferase [Streptomyces maremycinicus]|nr:SAM-dependent methyltransferase [Streptomyces sp. B9173]
MPPRSPAPSPSPATPSRSPSPSPPDLPSAPSPAPASALVPEPTSAPSSSRDALVAVLRAAGCVFAEDEAELILTAARTPDEAEAMAARRAAGLPLEHVVGWAEFHGLRITVGPGVFVPRRRTEFLVDQALAAVPHARVVVDLCCGSGAVGAALAARLGPVELHAADIDAAAVACARRNIAGYGGHAHAGDLFAALPGHLRGRTDILAANVPYVPSGEVPLLPAEARDHEPLTALDGGGDGLDVLRRVVAQAPSWLAPGGCLLVETSARQAPAAVEAFTRGGLTVRLAEDEERYAHVVLGTRVR